MPTDDAIRSSPATPSFFAWLVSLLGLSTLFGYHTHHYQAMAAEKNAKKNVVIVGGGFAGGQLARELSKKLDASRFNLVLINARPFFTHLPAMVRIPVSAEDKLEDKALFGFDKLFHNANGTVKVGKVVSISETEAGKGGEVVLEDGEKVPYETLVLATGSTWPSIIELPDTESGAQEHIKDWRSKIEKANHVVIVGAGSVGLEVAGEIKYAYPKKNVTIVHKDSQVLNSIYPAKFRKDLERRVRLRNIDLILGDSIEIPPEGTTGITTSNGKHIADADLIQAFGSRPNTSFVASLGKDVLTDRGYVKVNQYLEVQSHPGVFAIGDIIEWDEQKQAAKTSAHDGVVLANILSFLNGKPSSKPYKGSPELIVIPLGKSGGAAYFGFLGGISLGDFVSKTLKGKDLLVGMSRSGRGL